MAELKKSSSSQRNLSSQSGDLTTILRNPSVRKDSMNETESLSVLSIGLLADIQYADTADGSNHDQTVVRRYRQSLKILKEAAKYFESVSPEFCVLLGDVIDQKSRGMEYECMKCVLDICEATNLPWYMVIGNHDVGTFPRDVIHSLYTPVESVKLQTSSSKMYYEFTLYKSTSCYRCIFLDSFDISAVNASSKENLILGNNLLVENNSSFILQNESWSSISDWFADQNGVNKRYVPYNGGISKQQIEWLYNILDHASNNNQKAIIFSHCPISVQAAEDSTLLWNYSEVLDCVHHFHHTVIAYISGHDHNGGYSCDDHGIHHIIPTAPLECAVNEVSYGTMHIYTNYFTLDWTGKIHPPEKALPYPDKFYFPSVV
mmetsp:Transcript_20140/g.20236  ORF Transcript_20140/g.20236 Transcript_20140/m.20236 type:complete len:375 (+) Transcript_20140:102-1226(+)